MDPSSGQNLRTSSGQNWEPGSSQNWKPSSGQNWDPQFRLVRTEDTALVSQLIFQLFFCSCSACWSKAVENAGRSISVRFARRSIERHAFSAGFACRSERHAKTVENARTSIERHASSSVFAGGSIERHAVFVHVAV